MFITFIKLFVPYIWNCDNGVGSLLRKFVLIPEQSMICFAWTIGLLF